MDTYTVEQLLDDEGDAVSDYAKVRAILDAATPGPWGGDFGVCTVAGELGAGAVVVATTVDDADATAIVVARNLAPELLAVAEAAENVLYIGAVRPFRDTAEDRLGAALDALHAKMKETL